MREGKGEVKAEEEEDPVGRLPSSLSSLSSSFSPSPSRNSAQAVAPSRPSSHTHRFLLVSQELFCFLMKRERIVREGN